MGLGILKRGFFDTTRSLRLDTGELLQVRIQE
jgi:hypothetical protein